HPAWASRRRLMAVYCAGLLVLIGVLVTRSPWFGLFALTGYIHTYELLSGRWRVVGVTATAALHVTAIFGGRLPDPNVPAVAAFVLLVTVISGLTVAFSRWGEITTSQNEQRKRIIVELAEANAKLEAAMAENAELQARLLAQAREAGTLDERQRMAREIHDTLAQGLTGIITQVQAARHAAGRPDDWRRHLDNAADLARESLAEARRTVEAVGPEPLEGAGLPDALADVVARWSELHGVRTEVHTTGTVRPLHPEVEVALLRTAQEALANVAKHAAASRVGLTLSYLADLVTLDVRDDGVGFDPDGVRGADGDGGFGLTVMRQRVGRLAGTLEIESEPGAGTAVFAGVPAIPREPPDG
ncbi:MAG TPA: sensor histidine kinase, partial [Actinomycetes bacterium]|nr:sensor histidine kinase [Actinomycetes bacterium]